jgi:hypothetical protein
MPPRPLRKVFMKVTVKGIPRAKEQLKKALGLDFTIRKTLTAVTAERIRTEAYSRTPVCTGALRASGKVVVHGDDISYVNPRPYAPFVEYGTGQRGAATWEDFYGRSRLEKYLRAPTPAFRSDWPGMPAQPYARPAIVATMDALVDTLRNITQEELK